MNKKRIVYIDDDENCLELFLYTFSKSFDITLVEETTNLSDVLKNGNFDAVITDFEMPDLNGLELLRKVKDEFPSLPVIFFTGQGNEEIARNAFLNGASDYFIKDFDGFACKERLINSINNAIEKSQAETGRKESDKKLRAIIENTPDIILQFDTDLRLVYITPNFSDYIGKNCEFFYGKTLDKTGFSHSSIEQLNEDFNRVLRTGKAQEGEIKFSSQRGLVIFNYRIIPEFNREKKIQSIMCIGRDITAQKKIEQDYKILFEKMLNGFALMESINNDDGTPYEFRFIAVNPAFERLMGLTAADIAGKTTAELPQELGGLWYDAFKITTITQTPVYFVHYFPKYDRYLEINGFRTGVDQFAVILEDATDRIKAEIALRQSEERFRSYLENAPDAVFVTDSKARFRDVNRAACIMSGYSRDEMSKMCTIDVLAEEFRQRGLEALSRVVNDGSASGELVVQRKDGSRFDAAFEVVKIDDKTILGFCKDVTAYRSAINELRSKEKELIEHEKIMQKSYSELHAVFDAFPGIIQTLDRDFNIINASQSLLDSFGYKSIEDVKGKKCFGMWKQLNTTCPDCEVSEVLRNGKTVIRISTREEAEVTGMWFNSYIAPIKDKNGVITGAIECMMDITELKKTQDALRENETKMKQIIDNAAEGIVEIDKDFRISFVNKTVVGTLGYKREEYIGQSITKFVFHEDLPEIIRRMQQRAMGKSARYKVRLRAKDGSPYWAIAIATPFLDENGNFKGSFVVFIDINERTKLKHKENEKLISI
ncbi:MAG: PAS domain S-box protein [Firmicutes bacterium]|nr:PAS domain S-box protein [Bacillota bacterium]